MMLLPSVPLSQSLIAGEVSTYFMASSSLFLRSTARKTGNGIVGTWKSVGRSGSSPLWALFLGQIKTIRLDHKTAWFSMILFYLAIVQCVTPRSVPTKSFRTRPSLKNYLIHSTTLDARSKKNHLSTFITHYFPNHYSQKKLETSIWKLLLYDIISFYILKLKYFNRCDNPIITVAISTTQTQLKKILILHGWMRNQPLNHKETEIIQGYMPIGLPHYIIY